MRFLGAAMWFLRHAFAIAVLPVTVVIVVPVSIARRYGVSFRPPANPTEWVSVVFAAILFAGGITLFITTVFLFVTAGRGTLAPWDPPARLVVRGPYRFVRNPMISGVVLIAFAESLFLRSAPHAGWAVAFLLLNLLYIPALEEPMLERRFGAEYLEYKRNVPGLLPRLRPWRG